MSAIKSKANTITLEISGEDITADKFTRSVRLFFDLINDVATDVSGKPKAIEWVVSVKEGSIGLCATAKSVNGSKQLASKTVRAIKSGIEAIGKRTRRPAHFSDTALKKLSELGSITGLGDEGIERLSLDIGKKRCELSPASVSYVDEILGTETSSHGTIEGQLLALKIKGRLNFSVWEHLTGKEIKCFFPDEMFDDVIAAVRSRIAVYGLVRYRKNGEPASVEIEHINIFPEENELPTFSDMIGILKD